ncbi:universal stress protein [Malassezia pachydermatis]|uniref:Universal stress protein n=1 Tax=Malassezia pachydermatis TaxID=77020 RepID=A0A0M8MQS9_9BASI|nr:universal stress protein [Malassezia pachydermatis]KOS16468.1 universal stress protein [Malassezia pachydermatis]
MSSDNTQQQGFFGVEHQTSGSGTITPGAPVTEISQTPALEAGNPFDKMSIPQEARNQHIVGHTGEKVGDKKYKILLAMDGTEASDLAFKYVMEKKVFNPESHIFLTTVLPANVLGGPWVSGPLSIDARKQNELLKQLRQQAVERMNPYRKDLQKQGFSVTMHVLHGDVRASLLKVCDFHKVDIIVVGKRNLGWKRALSSGTISSYLVNHSPVPVHVVK